jgi:hypothetical protein
MVKHKMICKTCGSENVFHDAWAAWDNDAQEWVLNEWFDMAFCQDCDGETTILKEEVND